MGSCNPQVVGSSPTGGTSTPAIGVVVIFITEEHRNTDTERVRDALQLVDIQCVTLGAGLQLAA